MIVSALRRVLTGGYHNMHAQSQLLKYNHCLGRRQLTRMLSSHHVSKNIEFLTQDNQISSKNIVQHVNVVNNRPLLIILTWLLSKRQHVMKYVTLYTEQGFDVAVVSLTPWQLLWPAKGSRVSIFLIPWQLLWPIRGSRLVAADLLTFLKQNESYQQILLHGFSVGGYMWGEVLDLMERDKKSQENKYIGISDRIIGQVWDSIADVNEIPIGFPRAVFPKNMMLQGMLRKYLEYHMNNFHEQATQYYIRSSQVFHTNPICVPALLFVSETDPVGTVPSNVSLRDAWESIGVKTYMKIFEKSPHVAHFHTYPKEYVAELYAFLQKLNLIQNEEKIRSRL